ncbi:MAG: phosphomannomutase/phosphoglucomutase [Bacteroidota bacterium]
MNWSALQNGSDIRGVALEGIEGQHVNLTSEVTKKIGIAFAKWLGKQLPSDKGNLRIGVGMDSRLSGPVLKESVCEGLSASGCDVWDCKLASTPAMFMSTILDEFNFDGAIMLTASHLPFNRNGMKFFTKKGGLEKANITEILEIAQRIELDQFNQQGAISDADLMSAYANHLVENIRNNINAENFQYPLKGFKIVVDAGNGAGGFYATKVIQELGAEISGSQFLEPDGNFPNHIPNPEDKVAMASIQEAVIKNNADLGIIFDTDVDRAAVVDHLGNPVNRNSLIALMAAIVLEEHPGITIVTDSITSDGLKTFIEDKLKGKHHRFKRGYKNVINESIRLNENNEPSWLAIETSGHAALKENYFLDDGAYLVSKVVIKMARLKQKGKTILDLINELPQPKESSEYRINIKAKDFRNYGQSVIEALENFSENNMGWEIVPNNYEGIRIACDKNSGNGWFLLRLSLHDPVIPLNIETEEQGGVKQIANILIEFFKEFESLDLSAFDKIN